MNGTVAKLPVAPTPPARQKRLVLAGVISGVVMGALRVLIHGVDGVGKSTFAASAPRPIFLGTEDGTEHLDVARFPAPESWQDVLDAVTELSEQKHDYQTLVIDTLDWAEPLLWADVCRKAQVASVEDVGGGYGKGYVAAVDGWRHLVAQLERLQRERGMGVILLAHSLIKTFKNPEGEDFDRYVLKLNDKAAGLLREWCKGVYFANYETFAQKDKAKRVRGISTGARLLYTQRTAAFDAKDRYGLPEQLPLSWEEFEKARASGKPASAENLTAEIQRKAKQLGGDMEKQTLESLSRVGGDVQKLAILNNWCNARVGEKGAQ